MTHLKYAFWFLQTIGGVVFFGFVGAFFLSRFSGYSETSRSRIALALAAIILITISISPTYSCGRSLDAILRSIVYTTFGLTFAMVRLRFERRHSIAGWICAVFNGLFIKAFFDELMGKV